MQARPKFDDQNVEHRPRLAFSFLDASVTARGRGDAATLLKERELLGIAHGAMSDEFLVVKDE